MANTLRREAARPLLALVCFALFGCPPPPPPECIEGDEPTCPDAGQPPADLCNSVEEALSLPECQLTLGQAHQAYISFSGDEDFYMAQMPALTARSLLHVNAGYAVPNTAVNLSVNLLREDAKTSLGRKVDRHGQAAPKPLDIIVPFSESNARVVVLVGDEGAGLTPNFDAKNPYNLKVEVLDNPDQNEPNDTAATATAIPLVPQGTQLNGQQTGTIATENDVDRFKFTAPSGRKVIYLHLTAPVLSPPPPFRLAYVLLDPSGKQVSEGSVANVFLPVDLATARLSISGEWTVLVQAYRSPLDQTPIPGDLRLKYTLAISIFDELDQNEPNDTLGTAKLVTLGAGASQTFTGRLGYVPDPDWFKVDLPATGAPSVFAYKVAPASASGRFAPLALLPDRQVRVVKQVTQGATAQDRQVACKNDQSVCPRGYDPSDTLKEALVDALCTATDPPQCLWSERNETPGFDNLRNLEGTLPVPAQGAVYFLSVQDEGTDYADDRDYTLSLRRLDDADEAMRAGLPGQTQSVTIQQSASFPDPPATGEISGAISYGHGRVIENDMNRAQGVRAPEDYDAVPSDLDRIEFVFPAGLAAPYDRTWTLQWEIQHAGGGAPSDLALELQFCSGSADGGGCTPSGQPRVIAYSASTTLMPWYGSSTSDRTQLWDKKVGASSTTITALPAGCFCFEPAFVQGGRFTMTVVGVDRTSYAATQYKLRTAFTDYPQSYSGDGGARLCPAPADGGAGCQFTR
ncbi:MAG: cell-cell cohesion protein MtsF [Myxococcales bacterium]|nr:cell-cell cohesion protein MtsF [Myxococcales bacterium]